MEDGRKECVMKNHIIKVTIKIVTRKEKKNVD